MPLYMICNGTCINEYGVVAIMAKNLWHSILPRILLYILPRILPYILPYILNDSVRIRWEFVESLDMFGWLLRISHRWAGLFAFHVSWSVYDCMVYQRNLAKILWQNLCHNDPTKFQPNKIAKNQLYRESLQIVKYHGSLQYIGTPGRKAACI